MPQDLAWSRVQRLRHAPHVDRRHRPEISADRKIPTDQTIRMFGPTALPRRIGTSKEERCRPALESAINMLEHHGLQRVLSYGADGFSRMVGILIIAANLVRFGRILRDYELERERRDQRRAA
ncbi:MAG: hypothetical protein OXE94_00160 [Aestuariivita sp.]|nr:hypothetical protein [Aestuariivita sp.]